MITLQILTINSILLDCKLHKIAVKKIIVKNFLSNAKTKLKRQAYTRGCVVCR